MQKLDFFIFRKLYALLMDDDNVDTCLLSFRKEILRWTWIFEYMSNTKLLKVFHYVKQQKDEMYASTAGKIESMFTSDYILMVTAIN